jgi:hypothetical protein
MRAPTLLATLLCLLPAALDAQPAGALPAATFLPGSTRAMALGDAYMMDAGHADALFYHPALLTEASGFGLDLQRWGPEGTAAAASGAMEWLGGGIGIGLRTLQYSAPGPGAAAAPGGQDHLFERGAEPSSELIATIGYARETFFEIDLGVGVDFADVRVGGSHESGVLVDVGVSREVGPVVVGLTAHDIGSKPISDHGSAPSRVALGAGGYGHELGIFDLGYAATVGYDEADETVTWGGGVEVGYWPVQGRTFVARVGVHDVPDGSDRSPLTTGFAFWGDDITIEWAWHPFADASDGGTHRFGVRWR